MTDPRAIILSGVLSGLGYEPVSKSSIRTLLSQISPSGGTALLDSVGLGLNLILKLNQLFNQLNSSDAWNFVHIVITDGVDNSSRIKLENLAALFNLIGRSIPKERCLTVFIGVELDSDALVKLALLKTLGGDNCQLHNVNNVQLNDIFSRINATIGVRRQVNVGLMSAGGRNAMAVHQVNTPFLRVVRKNFAVLLNLDISGSMSGRRFNSLKSSVDNFMRNLDQNDIISCLVFNDKVQLLNNL